MTLQLEMKVSARKLTEEEYQQKVKQYQQIERIRIQKEQMLNKNQEIGGLQNE